MLWKVSAATIAGVVMGVGELAFCIAILVFGIYRLRLDVATLQTLAFVVIVFGNQATTYTNRERRHLWSSHPSVWLFISSVVDLAIAATLAIAGIAMKPLPAWVVAAVFAAACVFALALDLVKVPVLRRLSIN